MLTQTTKNSNSGYRSSDLGKCICVSFPHHEKKLIDDLDDLADQEFITRSQYIRRLIRREKQSLQNQRNQLQWSDVVGAK